MKEIEKLYMLFSVADIYFLIPLFWVKSVISGEKAVDDWPELDFGFVTDKNASSLGRYQLELQKGHRRFVLKVDEVIGIQEIPAEQIRRIPARVINDRNRYLYAVAHMEQESGEDYLAYLVNPEVLWELTGECGEK